MSLKMHKRLKKRKRISSRMPMLTKHSSRSIRHKFRWKISIKSVNMNITELKTKINSDVT